MLRRLVRIASPGDEETRGTRDCRGVLGCVGRPASGWLLVAVAIV